MVLAGCALAQPGCSRLINRFAPPRPCRIPGIALSKELAGGWEETTGREGCRSMTRASISFGLVRRKNRAVRSKTAHGAPFRSRKPRKHCNRRSRFNMPIMLYILISSAAGLCLPWLRLAALLVDPKLLVQTAAGLQLPRCMVPCGTDSSIFSAAAGKAHSRKPGTMLGCGAACLPWYFVVPLSRSMYSTHLGRM